MAPATSSLGGPLLQPYHESDGPALDFGLEQRLKRLDSRLLCTFSSWSIDRHTGQPIIDAVTGAPVLDPAHHLWIKAGGGWTHIDLFPISAGGFGHLNARYLEVNKQTTETIKPAALYRLLQEKKGIKQELEKRRHLGWRKDRTMANKRRIGDLVFEGKSGYRQAKPVSFPGQTNHSTPGQVLRDAREDGWELE